MFIPISINEGYTAVEITADDFGEFSASCGFTIDSQYYEPNSTVSVVRNKTITLQTVIEGFAEYGVRLNEREYVWYTDTPKTIQYVDSDAYKNLTGNQYGKLQNIETGVEFSYVETESFSGGDSVAAIDYAKKDIWFFNKIGEVKRLRTASVPVQVIFIPRWSMLDGTETDCYVVTTDSLLLLSDTMEVTETFSVESGVVAASGDVRGMVVLAYENKLAVWKADTIEQTLALPEIRGVHSLFVAPDNTYIMGTTEGIAITWQSEGEWISDMLTVNAGRYWSFDITALNLYAVDAFNRCVVRIELAERTFNAQYFDKVPRDVTVDGDHVWVSFLDDSKVRKYDALLENFVEHSSRKSYGAAMLDDYLVTDLYVDASNLTKVEDPAATQIFTMDKMARNEPFVYRWNVTWERPTFVRVGSTGSVVRVNGNVFVEGWLRRGDSVAVELEGVSDYYLDRYVALVGHRSAMFEFRTVPKLFPDYTVVDRILSAFLRVDYSDMFEITGMTWDYDVGIELQSKDVQFSVNDGPVGSTGRITNGDIVTVVGQVKSLVAQRTAHVIKTEFGEPVAEWTLLPMLLDGSVIRSNTSLEKDRFGGLKELNKRVSGEAMVPKLGAAVNLNTVNSFGECAASGSCYDGSFSPELNQSTRLMDVATFSGQGTASATFKLNSNGTLMPSTDMYSFEQGAFRFTRDAIYGTIPKLEGVLFSNNWSYVGNNSYVQNVRPKGAYTSVDVESVTYYSSLTSPTIVESRGAYAHRTSGVDYYPFSIISNHLFEGAWDARPVDVTHNVSVSLEVYVTGNDVRIGTETLVTDMSSRHEVGQQYLPRSIKIPIESHMDMRMHRANLPYELPFQRPQEYTFAGSRPGREAYAYPSKYPSVSMRLLDVIVVQSAQASTRSVEATPVQFSLNVNTVESEVHKANSESRRTVVTEGVKRSAAARMVSAPRVAAVVSSYSQFTFSDELSNFGSLEQAQAYAASIGAENMAEYKQINGSWVFTTRPDADSATCGIVQPPPQSQRTYGYMGGG